MTATQDLEETLQKLMGLPAETEEVEFKEAKNDFHFDDLGKYFSALSNEANLKKESAGWMVFGVTDRPPRQIVGSNYRLQKPGLEKLKIEIAKQTNHQTAFIGIHELTLNGKRVVLFQIPPAAHGIPTTWKGVAYGRTHASLGPLSLHKIELIRRQAVGEDWSSQICKEAKISDLDPQAITLARKNYKKKYPALAIDVDQWDDITFLNKAKICISGKIARASIILLGKNESEHFISPAIARVTWVLKDTNEVEKDYEHFGPPLLLAVNKVFAKIRNLTYRYMPDYELSEPGRVKVNIIGKVIDERYTRMLMRRTDLGLWDVIALDKVQKGKPITKDEFVVLKAKRLIEGRRPNLFVSAEVAAATETKADFIRKRAFDKQHYKKMVEEYLQKFKVATRSDLDNLLLKNLSDALTIGQKKNLVTNLLQTMRRDGIMRPVGGKRGRGTEWVLYNKS